MTKDERVPSGWVRAKLGELVSVHSGVGFPKSYQGRSNEKYPVYKVADISNAVLGARGYLTTSGNEVSESDVIEMKGFVFPVGATLFAKIGEAVKLNRRAYVMRPGLADNNVMAIVPLVQWSSRFAYYFMKTVDLSSASRSTTVPSLRKADVEELCLCLPPIEEQKQIANKLDELLARVDSIKTRLDVIPAILKRFRQSVLAAAVSGRLTEDWRDSGDYSDVDEYYNAPELWERMSLGSIVELVTSGSRGWAKYYSDFGCIFIRSQNINTDRLELEDTAYVLLPHSTEGKRTKVQEGDLLVTITGANVTKCARVAIDIGEAYVSQHVALIRLLKPESSVFVHLVLIAPNAGRRQLMKSAYGGGKPGLNLQNLRDVSLAMPSDLEQVEIVKRTHEAFSFADQIEQRLTEAQSRINQLTQSILAKAFRGELTADWREQHLELISGEHSAQALLDRIRAERENLAPVKRNRKKKAASQ